MLYFYLSIYLQDNPYNFHHIPVDNFGVEHWTVFDSKILNIIFILIGKIVQQRRNQLLLVFCSKSCFIHIWHRYWSLTSCKFSGYARPDKIMRSFIGISRQLRYKNVLCGHAPLRVNLSHSCHDNTTWSVTAYYKASYYSDLFSLSAGAILFGFLGGFLAAVSSINSRTLDGTYFWYNCSENFSSSSGSFIFFCPKYIYRAVNFSASMLIVIDYFIQFFSYSST